LITASGIACTLSAPPPSLVWVSCLDQPYAWNSPPIKCAGPETIVEDLNQGVSPQVREIYEVCQGEDQRVCTLHPHGRLRTVQQWERGYRYISDSNEPVFVWCWESRGALPTEVASGRSEKGRTRKLDHPLSNGWNRCVLPILGRPARRSGYRTRNGRSASSSRPTRFPTLFSPSRQGSARGVERLRAPPRPDVRCSLRRERYAATWP
jgi:hypothetical protein